MGGSVSYCCIGKRKKRRRRVEIKEDNEIDSLRDNLKGERLTCKNCINCKKLNNKEKNIEEKGEKKLENELLKKIPKTSEIGIQTENELAFSLFLEKKKEFEKMSEIFKLNLSSEMKESVILTNKKFPTIENHIQGSQNSKPDSSQSMIEKHMKLESKLFKSKNDRRNIQNPSEYQSIKYKEINKKQNSHSSLAIKLIQKNKEDKKAINEKEIKEDSLKNFTKEKIPIEEIKHRTSPQYISDQIVEKKEAKRTKSENRKKYDIKNKGKISSINTIKMFDNLEAKKINHYYKNQLEDVNKELKKKFETMGLAARVKSRELRRVQSSDAVGTPKNTNKKSIQKDFVKFDETFKINSMNKVAVLKKEQELFKENKGGVEEGLEMKYSKTPDIMKSSLRMKPSLTLNRYYKFPKRLKKGQSGIVILKNNHENFSENKSINETKKFSMLFPHESSDSDSSSSSYITGNISVDEKNSKTGNDENIPLSLRKDQSRENSNKERSLQVDQSRGDFTNRSVKTKSSFFFKSKEPIKSSVFKKGATIGVIQKSGFGRSNNEDEI